MASKIKMPTNEIKDDCRFNGTQEDENECHCAVPAGTQTTANVHAKFVWQLSCLTMIEKRSEERDKTKSEMQTENQYMFDIACI